MTDEPTKNRLTKESVSAWFDSKQARNHERREQRVSAEDVRAGLARRRAMRDETPHQRRWLQMAPAAVGVILLVCAGAIGASAHWASNSFEVETLVLGQQIERAQGELSSIPVGDADSAAAFSATVKTQLHDATRAASELAQLQQDYAAILFHENGAGVDDQVSKNTLQAAVDHRDAIGAYILTGSIPTNEGAVLDGDVLDPRTPWYIGFETDGRTARAPSTSSWAVASVMAVGPDEFTVAWLNRDQTGELNAWATATYNAAASKFSQFTVGKTTRGADSIVQVETGRK